MPLVFVYGPDSLQARIYDRLGASEVLGGALLEGWALIFNKPQLKGPDGLSNLAEKPGAATFGVLYELTRKQIEILEGYYGGYQRKDHRPPTARVRRRPKHRSRRWCFRPAG
jgi:hypothetical protein